MKKIFIGALALVLTATAAQAQTNDNGAQKPKREMRKGHGPAMDKLNLTDAQKAQMKTMMENRRNEMQALKNSDLPKDQLKEKRKAIAEKYRTQIQSMLTPEQKQQMQQMRAQRGDKAQKGQHKWNIGGKAKAGKGARASKGMRGMGNGKMAQELNLTDAQKKQMEQIRSDFRTKAQAIRSNSSLSADQKKAQMKSLMDQQKEQTKAVFTPEQIEKMKSLRKEKKNRTT